MKIYIYITVIFFKFLNCIRFHVNLWNKESKTNLNTPEKLHYFFDNYCSSWRYFNHLSHEFYNLYMKTFDELKKMIINKNEYIYNLYLLFFLLYCILIDRVNLSTNTLTITLIVSNIYTYNVKHNLPRILIL